MAKSDAGSLCPCGSGLEFARCCAGSELERAVSRHDFALGELENGRPAAAVQALKQAVGLAPRRVSAYSDLALAWKNLGRLEEAEQAYRDVLNVDPTYAVAHQSLGEILRDRGALEEARGCFENALRLNPTLSLSRLGLAQVLEDLGDLGSAARCYEEALVRSSAPAAVDMKLGAVLWKLGDSVRALEAFERAVAGAAGSAEAFYNLGCAQLELGRFGEAGRSAAEALRLRPVFSEAVTLRAAAVAASGDIEAAVALLGRQGVLISTGSSSSADSAGAAIRSDQTAFGAAVTSDPTVVPRAVMTSDPAAVLAAAASPISSAQRYLSLAIRLMNSRLFDPARRCLEAAVRESPREVMAQHLLTALSGAKSERPVEGYVRQLFDASAATFDRELVSKLGYDIPREMVQALLDIAAVPEGHWDVLDLGCGTGLVGEQVARYCRRLVGVDLAPNMIERARTRGCYTDLHCLDLMDALALEEPGGCDVVTAADVFIYVGKLDSVIPAISRVLRPGGWLAFSAEAVESIPGATSAEFRLGVMGRYAHGADYLRRLADANGFHIELLRPTRIRFEHRRPVEGWLTIWRSPR